MDPTQEGLLYNTISMYTIDSVPTAYPLHRRTGRYSCEWIYSRANVQSDVLHRIPPTGSYSTSHFRGR